MVKYAKPRNPKGRPVGAKAKVTLAAKQAIVAFIDGNSTRIQEWVDEVHQENGAKDALNAYIALLEFAVPKLGRQEISGLNGGAIEHKVTTSDKEVIERYKQQLLTGQTK